MPDPWFFAASALGGLVAGLVGLLVGGLGVFRMYLVLSGAMTVLSESVEGVNRRVEREIKTRAGEAGGRPSDFEKFAQEVLARASTPAGGDDSRVSRAEILRRADRK